MKAFRKKQKDEAQLAMAKRGRAERKKEKSSKTQKLPQKYDASEERRDNPFIPSNADIENIDIKDPNYLSTIATYLASNRSSEDINVIDKEVE